MIASTEEGYHTALNSHWDFDCDIKETFMNFNEIEESNDILVCESNLNRSTLTLLWAKEYFWYSINP